MKRISTKPAKKIALKGKPAESKKEAGHSVPLFDKEGKAQGKVTLPKELFGAKVNQKLLAQSVRVYLANQREGSAKTKTRGEVEGSTRKIYRQKGTGRARHGAIRAPIFVGGGIVFGPMPRDYHLTLTKDMKRKAIRSALSAKAGDTVVIDGLETVEPKTKRVVKVLSGTGMSGSTLLVVPKDSLNLVRAARNIEGVDILRATDLFPYALLTHHKIVFNKKALEESKAHFVK